MRIDQFRGKGVGRQQGWLTVGLARLLACGLAGLGLLAPSVVHAQSFSKNATPTLAVVPASAPDAPPVVIEGSPGRRSAARTAAASSTAPKSYIYSNTTLTACPAGQQLGYFYYDFYADRVDARAQTWCGAAQAELNIANVEDPNRFRPPYLLEQCVPGAYWIYSHSCGPGSTCPGPDRYISPQQRNISLLCLGNLQITLTGPAVASLKTDVLLTATTTALDGTPMPRVQVQISDPASGSVFCSGHTSSTGELTCASSVPTQRAGDVTLEATCSDCVNTATHRLFVKEDVPPVEIKPGMCVANPILPSSGEKRQFEREFTDMLPHSLSLVRIYRTRSTAGQWSHNFAASLDYVETTVPGAGGQGSLRPLRVVIQFADRQAVFVWNTNGTWDATGSPDTLTRDATGWVYFEAATQERHRFDLSGRILSRTSLNGWTYTYTYTGATLTAVTNAFGRQLQFGYSASGDWSSATAPDGTQVTYGYDGSGRLATASYPGGHQRRYVYDDPNFPTLLTGLIDESGIRFATWAYDEFGRAILSEHAGGADRTTISYSGGTSATVNDPSGASRWIAYSRNGGQLAVTYSSTPSPQSPGDMMGREQGPTGLITSEVDYALNQTLFTWDEARQLQTGVTQGAGTAVERSITTEWHPTFRLPVRVQEPGRTTETTYDSQGNPVSVTIRDGTGQVRTSGRTYTAQGLVEDITDRRGGKWRHAYSASGGLASVRDPAGRVVQFTRDAMGRVLTATDAAGTVTQFEYDARGRLLRQTTAGESTVLAYLPTGLLATITWPSGHQVTYGYDQAHRLVQVRDNRGSIVDYVLDAAGNIVREEARDASGALSRAATFAYNQMGLLAEARGAVGQTSVVGYDQNGLPEVWVDPLNQVTRLTRDALRRPATTTLADDAQATQSWSPLDALTQVTDPKGVTTRYTTNAFGEVMSETSPDIGTITYQRDANGAVTRMEDAKGQITHIERDALGRIQRIAYADGQQVTYSYNAAGYVTRIEDRSGRTDYTRDTLGRILTKTQSVNDDPAVPSQFRVEYTHAQGQLAALRYPSGLQVFYRRATGRVIGIDIQEPGKKATRVPFVNDLAYTALGQPKAWTWSSGAAAQRSFDADGRMTANEFASYTYDTAGRITAITQSLATRGTGTAYLTPLTWQVGYDSRNRLTSFTRAGAESLYTYDANSNRLTGIERKSSDSDLDGEFDATDHRQETAQAQAIEATSNRLLGFTQTLTTHNKGKTKSVVVTPVVYAVDANGAMTSDGLREFIHDASGRLAKVRVMQDGEAASISYLHNALGQRVFKGEPLAEQTLPNQQTLGTDFITWLKKQFGWLFTQAAANTSIGTAYVYGDTDGEIPEWAILGEYDNGSAKGKGRTETIWLPLEDGSAIPVGLYRNGKLLAIHTDHLGTPRVMKNEANEVVWQWPYSAFGQNKPTGVLKETDKPRQALTAEPLVKATNPAQELELRFPGQYFDVETGLAYNLHRSYLAGQGRYTQADPIGLAGGANRFGYVEGSPSTYADPTGTSPALLPWILTNAPWLVPAATEVVTAGLLIASGAAAPGPAGLGATAASQMRPTAAAAKALAGEMCVSSDLARRTKALHDVLDPLAANRRTTAILSTTEGVQIAAAGGRDLSPAQRAAAMAMGASTAKAPGLHAEVTALGEALANGLTPASLAASRQFCPTCRAAISASGGTITSPTTANWKR